MTLPVVSPQSLFHLKEHDLEKLGVRRAADRLKMLKSLATLMDTAYPGRERTGSRASALRKGKGNAVQQQLEEPPPRQRSNSFKAKYNTHYTFVFCYCIGKPVITESTLCSAALGYDNMPRRGANTRVRNTICS
jgi:hypothetical protein